MEIEYTRQIGDETRNIVIKGNLDECFTVWGNVLSMEGLIATDDLIKLLRTIRSLKEEQEGTSDE